MMISRKLFFMFVLLLPAHTAAFNEGMLETLFTTPAERRNIDASRQGVSTTGIDTLQSGAGSVHITGIVTRDNDKSVVWINGKNTMNNTMVDGVKVYPNAIKKNNKIPMRVDGRMIYLKPGETWSEGSGISDTTGK